MQYVIGLFSMLWWQIRFACPAKLTLPPLTSLRKTVFAGPDRENHDQNMVYRTLKSASTLIPLRPYLITDELPVYPIPFVPDLY